MAPRYGGLLNTNNHEKVATTNDGRLHNNRARGSFEGGRENGEKMPGTRHNGKQQPVNIVDLATILTNKNKKNWYSQIRVKRVKVASWLKYIPKNSSLASWLKDDQSKTTEKRQGCQHGYNKQHTLGWWCGWCTLRLPEKKKRVEWIFPFQKLLCSSALGNRREKREKKPRKNWEKNPRAPFD